LNTLRAVPPLRRALELTLLSLLSLVAALGAAELGLRAASFSWHLQPERVQFGWPRSLAQMEDRYRPDPALIWTRRDHQQLLLQARRERPDVVFLGDSCVELSDWPQRFLRLVHERRPRARWRGLTLGTAGWTTYQGRVQLVRDVLPVRPRIVTIGFGWNDHWLAFGRPDDQLARLLALGGSRWGDLRLVQLAEKAALGGGEPTAGPRVPLPAFRDNLEAMVRAARRAGVVPVLLTAPSSHQRGAEPQYLRGRFVGKLEDLVPLHESYVAAVREVAAGERAALCDLQASFAAMPRPRRRASFLRDGIHPNERGTGRFAELVYGCFERDRLFTADGRRAARPIHGESARSQN
jgi:lysophospholipase L1-like esterase